MAEPSVRCCPCRLTTRGAAQDLAIHPDPLVDLSMQRHTTALRCALLNLPIRYREMIVLCDLQELSYVDAARRAELRRRHRSVAAAPGPRDARQAAVRPRGRPGIPRTGHEIIDMSCHDIEPLIIDFATGRDERSGPLRTRSSGTCSGVRAARD